MIRRMDRIGEKEEEDQGECLESRSQCRNVECLKGTLSKNFEEN